MTTPLEALRKAKAVLEDPTRWTTGAFARDLQGDGVAIDSAYAVSWCAEGALLRSDLYQAETFGYLAKACSPHPPGGIPEYNDDLPNHAALLAWFDRAIELAEAEHGNVA